MTCITKRQALLSTSATILGLGLSLSVTAVTAHAQDGGPAIEEIVVTGSRAVANGLKAPTPVTMVSSEQLINASPSNVADGLNKLPQFVGSSSPASQGVSTFGGASNFLNLRNLGAQRTLVLLDGRRAVPSTATGTPDVNLMPNLLLQRVDVVTGGASAAYGSDAVAGVVNFVLDKKFEGMKGEVGAGISEHGDNFNYKAGAAFGSAFAGDRGHVLFSADYDNNEGLPDAASRDWFVAGYAPINNPGVTAATPASPSNPTRLIVPNVKSSAVTYGGLITSTGVLRGIEFGPGGQPLPFNFGTLTTALTQVGGSGVDGNDDVSITPSSIRNTAFGRLSYDVTEDFTVFFEGTYGRDKSEFKTLDNFQVAGTQFTIFSGNPYLPASIQQTMTANNIASFTMGRMGRDLGFTFVDVRNKTRDFVAGFNGRFGDGWTYDAYYENGRNVLTIDIDNNTIQTNLYRAADAVRNPTTGAIVCRTTLTTPTDGCVPINLFGEGSPSQSAIDYVTGIASSRLVVKQQVAAFAVRGEPWLTWAGPVAVAFGGEYRKETADQTADAISSSIITGGAIRGYPTSLNNKLGGFQIGNPQPLSGQYDIKEGFLEVDVPLASETTWAESLNVNGAIRYADYETSGGVTTWKVGAVYEPITDLRFRATRSRDIRAGNVNELFQSAGQSTMSVVDRFRNAANTTIISRQTGNTALDPEKADTTVIGVSYGPEWLDGFDMSVDYYKIKIDDAIAQLGAQVVVDQCFAGSQDLCALIQRDPGVGGALGPITTIFTRTLNVAAIKKWGVDIEARYATALGEGDLTVRGLAAYTGRQETATLGAALPQIQAGTAINPHWRATFSANYTIDRLSLFAQERFIGAGNIDPTLNASAININRTKATFYTDLTARYRLGEQENIEVYGTINNVFDQDPRFIPSFMSISTRATNQGVYDVVGRAFYVGARFKM